MNLTASATEHPYITREIPGIGGTTRHFEDDFVVDEEPAYAPSGRGDHVFVRIEKRGLTTAQAVARMATALGCNPRDVGTAGLKDKRAVTTQWVSFPPPLTLEQVRALSLDDIRVLEVERHEHKLRTGHLRSNAFRLVIRGIAGNARQCAEAAQRILEQLQRPPGSPNWFGAQRFGNRGDNAAIGRALVTGERLERRTPRGKQRRLFISAYQSMLFNRYLSRRIASDLYRTALLGDLMHKSSGGLFECSEPDVDQLRLDKAELAPTGPMFGSKMRTPSADTPAAAHEQVILSEEGLAPASFSKLGKLALGTRRPIAVPLGHATARPIDDEAVEVVFSLPPGSYATAVLRELMKPDTDLDL